MKKQLILITITLFLFISCGNDKKAELEWLKGGNLHNSNVTEWINSNDKNKLATCADFVANIKKANNEKYQSISLMKSDAETMKNCIDEAVKANGIENMKISEIAVACNTLMK
jgi:hypothetical protein